MEASRDGRWDWDLQTGVVYCSHNYLRLIGYGDRESSFPLKTFLARFFLPEDARKAHELVNAALDAGEDSFSFELRLRHKDGHVVWTYCRARFFEPDARGRAQRCVGLSADITDFVRAQEQLLAAKSTADLAHKTKSEFLRSEEHTSELQSRGHLVCRLL